MSYFNKKTNCIMFIGFFILVSGFFCQVQVAGIPEFVVVRESDLRFGPVNLPLEEEIKPELISYLKAGGDKANKDIVNFYNEKFYQSLLAFLSGNKVLKITDIFVSNVSKEGIYALSASAGAWFQEPIVLTVVDATQKRPSSEQSYGPIVVSDGHLWWIFYRDPGNKFLSKLLVTLPLTKLNTAIRKPVDQFLKKNKQSGYAL
jgi:hypothetical protein